MAFAAVLTALGYYIILRRFCQGLLKIFLQGAATGEEVFPLCRLSTPPLAYFPAPAPPPAGDSGGRKISAPVRRLSLLHKSGGNIWYRLRIDGGGGNLYNRKGDL